MAAPVLAACATAAGAVAPCWQIRHTRQQRSSKDIAPGLLGLVIAVSSWWAAYGLETRAPVVIAANIVLFAEMCWMSGQTLKYDRPTTTGITRWTACVLVAAGSAWIPAAIYGPDAANVSGVIAAVLTDLIAIPEIFLLLTRKESDGLSGLLLASILVETAFWMGFGALVAVWPLFVCNVVQFAQNAVLGVLKHRYKGTGTNRGRQGHDCTTARRGVRP